MTMTALGQRLFPQDEGASGWIGRSRVQKFGRHTAELGLDKALVKGRFRGFSWLRMIRLVETGFPLGIANPLTLRFHRRTPVAFGKAPEKTDRGWGAGGGRMDPGRGGWDAWHPR